MRGTHFYLTGVFSDNKTTGYHVKLPQTIDLEGNWEVGLYSVSYPHSMVHVTRWVRYAYFLRRQSGVFQQGIIDYGYYHSMQDLVKAVNKALAKNVNDNIKLTYNAVKEKNGYQLGLFCRMSIILGFRDNDLKIVTETTVRPYVTNLTVVSTIYLYCDTVEPQVVGDTSAQLLKIA